MDVEPKPSQGTNPDGLEEYNMDDYDNESTTAGMSSSLCILIPSFLHVQLGLCSAVSKV
jgi:hypothetical protein